MMVMRRLASLWLAVGLALSGTALAVQPDEVLPNATLEQRARQISGGLRCLVCQNQSIDDSDAPLAKDLRILVRERLVAGDSDAAVQDFVVARYGDFVLLRPPFNPRTLALWAAPFLILLAALGFVWRRGRRMAKPAPQASALSPEERKRLDALLQDERD
jgi:cytochrome c-type biogenesis protein CcmH